MSELKDFLFQYSTTMTALTVETNASDEYVFQNLNSPVFVSGLFIVPLSKKFSHFLIHKSVIEFLKSYKLLRVYHNILIEYFER